MANTLIITLKITEEAHKRAHKLIAGNEIQEALLLLLVANNLAVNEKQ